MKFLESRWTKGLFTFRPEPEQQAQRIVRMQLHVVLPAKAGIIAVVLYYIFTSDWMQATPSSHNVALEFLRKFFLIYTACNVVIGGIFVNWQRFPSHLFQWLVFVLGLLDGLFVSGLVVITDGFDSIAYWLFPALIILNAVSIPLATPQIVLNMLLGVFYLGAGLVYPKVALSELQPPKSLHHATISIVQQPANTVALVDSNVTLTVVAQGTPPLVYQWFFNGNTNAPNNVVNGFTNSTLAIRKVQTNNAGTFQAVITNEFNSATSSMATLSIISLSNSPPITNRLASAASTNVLGTANAPQAGVNSLAGINQILPAQPMDIPTDPNFPKFIVLWLLTACCYGVQLLRRAIDESREFAVREGQLLYAGRLSAEFAHQIKNPLAIINNAVFSLQRAVNEGRTDLSKQLEIIREEVERSDKIITQIMGYAQLSEGHVEKLDLIDEVNAAIDQTFPAAVDTGVRVERRFAAHLPPLLMQRQHLAQILVNILQNAREALNGQGKVTVSVATRNDGSVAITVADTGPGIPPDKIERIFEQYYSTKEKGTGLGLAIVKHNVELYAGSVRAESELGKGARFILNFPSKTVMKPAI